MVQILEATPAVDSITKLRDRVSLTVANLKEATDLIVQKHYLHRGRTMAQMPYWIQMDGERVGVLLFAYPRMSVKFHGFSPMNLLELARMWLDPSVQGMRVTDSAGRDHAFPVATCAVGKSLRRIRQDWHGKYPHLPDVFAIVSWADQEHHEGTIYKAANFSEIGTSGGSLHGSTYRRNGGHDQLNPDYLHLKTAFLYEFKRLVAESEKTVARLTWAPIRPRPNRKLRDKLAQLQGRLLAQTNAVGSDV